MKLKKYFLFAVVMLFAMFALVGCGDDFGDPDDPNPPIQDPDNPTPGPSDPSPGPDDPVTPSDVNCALDRDNELCLDPETWSWDYNKDNWDGKGMTIKIMVLPINEYDPNNADYNGERKTEKRQLIARLESEYNIDLEYVEYPAEAPWGPERVKWLFQGVANGDDVGEIFLIDSSWIPTLSKNGAIAELYNLKRKTGIFADYNYEQSENYNLMASSNNKVYAYSVGEARPDHWLHYNQNLIDQYGLPDPATLWLDNEWTWSAFKGLLSQAQALFDQAEAAGSDKKYAMGGDYFEIAQGFVSARGGAFVKSGVVLLDNQIVVNVYNDLQEIDDLYWEPSGSTVSSAEFNNGLVLFNSGSMWFYGSSDRWPSTLDFEISAVPYPRMDEDVNLDSYKVPIGYESMYAIRNVSNGANGLNSAILFNIMDDLQNGLKPESAATIIDPTEKYKAYLEARLATAESVEAIMSIQTAKGLTYFEMIGVVSMSLGDGSHYGPYGIYPLTGSIIKNTNNDKIPVTELGSLRPIYQQKLDELLQG